MADALNHNHTLQSFTFNADDTIIDNATGLAMANALKHQGTLESLIFRCNSDISDGTAVALSEALALNVSLQELTFFGRPIAMDVLDRNKVMRDSRHALTGLARFTDDFDLGNLRDRALRASVLAFFLPPQCKWMPFEFRATCTGCANLRTHQDELMSTNTTASAVRQCEQPDDEIANQNGEEKEEQLTQAIEHSIAEAIALEEQLTQAIEHSMSE